MAGETLKIGIIGGTGLDNPDILEDRREEVVTTVYGPPSDALIHGKISGIDCILLPRHGRDHGTSPSNINYRANIWALKEAGCSVVLASVACGSLKEEVRPGDLVIIDQFVDRTTNRHQTLCDPKIPGAPNELAHLPMDTSYHPFVRKLYLETAKDLGIHCHEQGTVVCIEGPRFSTVAESKIYRSWGADLVSMTTVPEVVLAKEAGLLYASVAMATDYDCWRDCGEKVSAESVVEIFKQNAAKVTTLFKSVVSRIAASDWKSHKEELADTIRRSKVCA